MEVSSSDDEDEVISVGMELEELLGQLRSAEEELEEVEVAANNSNNVTSTSDETDSLTSNYFTTASAADENTSRGYELELAGNSSTTNESEAGTSISPGCKPFFSNCDYEHCQRAGNFVCKGCWRVAYCSELHQIDSWSKHREDCVFYALNHSPSLSYRGPFVIGSSSDGSRNMKHVTKASTSIEKGTKILEEKPFLICPWPRMKFRFTEQGIRQNLVIRNLSCFGCGKTLGFSWIRCEDCNLFLCSPDCLYLDNHKTAECILIKELVTSDGKQKCRKDSRLDLRNISKNEHYRELIYMDIMIIRLLIKLSDMQKRMPKKEFDEEWAKLNMIWDADSFSVLGNERRMRMKREIKFNFAFSYNITNRSSDLVWKLFCILDTNSFAFELPFRRFKVLCNVLSRTANSCSPNSKAFLVEPGMEQVHIDQVEANPNDLKVVLRAGMNIIQGSKITFPYVPVILGTEERRTMMHEIYLTWCVCLRCMDPTELGTCVTHIKCDRCSSGMLVPPSALVAVSSMQDYSEKLGKKLVWECRVLHHSSSRENPRTRVPHVSCVKHEDALAKMKTRDVAILQCLEDPLKARNYLLFMYRPENGPFYDSNTLKLCEDILRGTFQPLPDVLADDLKEFSNEVLQTILMAKKYYKSFMEQMHPGFDFEGFPVANLELADNELAGREDGKALHAQVEQLGTCSRVALAALRPIIAARPRVYFR